jgi:hypothetical protein
MYVDPTGLLSEKHEAQLQSLNSSGLSQETLSGIRAGMVNSEIAAIESLQNDIAELELAMQQSGFAEDSFIVDQVDSLNSLESDFIRNITVADFDQAPELATELLNQQLANLALESVGDPYTWGDKPQNSVGGGLDCSGFVEFWIEGASGVNIPTRNANSMATTEMTMPGDGSRGTLNFYDWADSFNTDFDHVVVVLENGRIVNPNGGTANNNLENAGIVQTRGPFFTNPVNLQVNWRFVLSLRD